MKLGRACAAGAVLWAVALPLTAGTALADQEPAPVAEQPSAPAEDPTAAPSDAAPPSVLPGGRAPATDTAPPRDGQVPVRPEGAPETGGGPEETGIDLAVTGGTAAAVAVAAGGAVLVLRRRRAGVR
jgi:hypothetical protein